ncbi:MAG: hypothetical protein R3C20_15010 [Planctomycetaceae bacterium]
MGKPAEEVIAVKKSIPSELRHFFEYVWYTGIAGHADWAETVSDDMIQNQSIAPVTGGLCDKKARRFNFYYRPCETPPCTWDIYLFDNEIEDIAKGRTLDLTLWKCEHGACRNLYTYPIYAICNEPRPEL